MPQADLLLHFINMGKIGIGIYKNCITKMYNDVYGLDYRVNREDTRIHIIVYEKVWITFLLNFEQRLRDKNCKLAINKTIVSQIKKRS